jgi:hypothetical protein
VDESPILSFRAGISPNRSEAPNERCAPGFLRVEPRRTTHAHTPPTHHLKGWTDTFVGSSELADEFVGRLENAVFRRAFVEFRIDAGAWFSGLKGALARRLLIHTPDAQAERAGLREKPARNVTSARQSRLPSHQTKRDR